MCYLLAQTSLFFCSQLVSARTEKKEERSAQDTVVLESTGSILEVVVMREVNITTEFSWINITPDISEKLV